VKRIQRKRIKGWRMPPNTVYVGRPTKWGNPFKLKLSKFGIQGNLLASYKLWLGIQLDRDPHFLDELKGKDLACWCPLERPCHADILLEKLEGGCSS